MLVWRYSRALCFIFHVCNQWRLKEARLQNKWCVQQSSCYFTGKWKIQASKIREFEFRLSPQVNPVKGVSPQKKQRLSLFVLFTWTLHQLSYRAISNCFSQQRCLQLMIKFHLCLGFVATKHHSICEGSSAFRWRSSRFTTIRKPKAVTHSYILSLFIMSIYKCRCRDDRIVFLKYQDNETLFFSEITA